MEWVEPIGYTSAQIDAAGDTLIRFEQASLKELANAMDIF